MEHQRTEHDSQEAKLTADPADRMKREKDAKNPEALTAEIRRQQAEAIERLSSEQKWFADFRTRFDSLQQLHTGIEWSEVEKALKANPESMARLLVLDAAGHKMNVFAEEGDEFVFVSAWDQVGEVSEDHRYICYDAEGERLAREEYGYNPRGNAVSIVAKVFDCTEEEAVNFLADPKYHEQLREAVKVTGGAWLKTDENIRETGYAFRGDGYGIYRNNAGNRNDSGSFRAALRVKKA